MRTTTVHDRLNAAGPPPASKRPRLMHWPRYRGSMHQAARCGSRKPAEFASDPTDSAEPRATVSGVLPNAPRKPSREELLSIIDDASRIEGNATTNEIRLRLGLAYGRHTEPTELQLRQVF